MQKKCMVIFGAGAVENAWAPILEAISEDVGRKVSEEGANSVFANYVFLLRWHWAIKGRQPVTISNNVTDEMWNKSFTEVDRRFQRIRKLISEKIDLHQQRKTMAARRGILGALSRIDDSSKFYLVNTNWDTCVDNLLASEGYDGPSDGRSTRHIHGVFSDSARLYLPSEMAVEVYRDPVDSRAMEEVQGSVIDAGQASDVVLFYGLGLSPLDSELSTILSAALAGGRVRKIFFVTRREHMKTVNERIHLLLGELSGSPDVKWLDPSKL